MDWEKMNIGDIGWRLVTKNQQQYLGPQVAAWRMEIKPRAAAFRQADHRDHAAGRRRAPTCSRPPWPAATPATSCSGSTTRRSSRSRWRARRITSWPTPASGRPVAKANVEFFGWRQEWRGAEPRANVLVKEFAELTDADGQLITDAEHAAAPIPVAHHGHHARRPAWPTWVSPTSGTAALRSRSTTRPRSIRSPTGRSIGPIRR